MNRLVCGGARLFAACVLLAGLTPASADSVELGALRDTTLYEDSSGSFGNGSGQHLFAGFAGVGLRRGLIAFDVAGNVPDGATITGVTLELYMSRTISGPEPVALHRAEAAWGEGASDAGGQEGGGTTAEPGDATWIHAFYPTEFWLMPGGEFAPLSSASIDVGAIGYYSWDSTAEMIADAQLWLDSPAANFGWVLIGQEVLDGTAKRFDSRENPDESRRPVLTVEYEEAAEVVPACAVTCQSPFECQGDDTEVLLDGVVSGEGALLAQWDGPCSILDPSSASTSAECAGPGSFTFRLTVTADENEDGVAGPDEASASCDLLVTVMDTQAPVLEMPSDQVLECTGSEGAVAEVRAASLDTCGPVTIVNSRSGAGPDASGSYPLGENVVSWRATDLSGQETAGWNTVSVRDTVPPAVTCNAEIVAEGGVASDDEDETDVPGTLLRVSVAVDEQCGECSRTSSLYLGFGCPEINVADGDLIRLVCHDSPGYLESSAPRPDDGHDGGTCAVRSGPAGELLVESYDEAFWQVRSTDCAGRQGLAYRELCAVVEEPLCEASGGEWKPLSCGHWSCGEPPECDAESPGCNCGPGRTFDVHAGCVPDVRCAPGDDEDEHGDPTLESTVPGHRARNGILDLRR